MVDWASHIAGRGLIVGLLLLGIPTSVSAQPESRDAARAALLYIRDSPDHGVSRLAAESLLIDVQAVTDSGRRAPADLASLSTLLRGRAAVAPGELCPRSKPDDGLGLERAHCALRTASHYMDVEKITLGERTGVVRVRVYWMAKPGTCCAQPVTFTFYEVELVRASTGWRAIGVYSTIHP